MGGKPKKEKRLAWHFLAQKGDGTPYLRDGRELVMGQWLVHEGDVSICNRGLHASTRAWDALTYSPGDYVTRVEVEDVREEHDDKFVCTRRKPLWGFDAEPVLRAFARRVAKDCRWQGEVPKVVLDWLETGDESLRSAAWSAAESAARSAARSAAWSAAWSAAIEKYNGWLEEMLTAAAPQLDRPTPKRKPSQAKKKRVG